MLTQKQKRELRSDLFRHLDGIVTAPTAFALSEKGVLDFLLEQGEISVDALAREFKANEGYLNVALRVLASQGWLELKIDNQADQVRYSTNERSAAAFALCPLYRGVVELLKFSGKFHRRRFEREPFLVLEAIFAEYRRNFGIGTSSESSTAELDTQVLKHIEGILVGPTTVALGMSGMFHKYFMEASFKPDEFHEDSESFDRLLGLFAELGWFERSRGTYRFTDKGLFFARRASAYGVTVSYIPTLRRLDDLVFGDPHALWKVAEGQAEMHVDRRMNVWGSGGAHSTYFKKVDEIIIRLFDQPIERQPKGIVDMGCGNGAFLEHIFDVIEQRTLRGRVLEEHPLFLVGADYNQAALKVSRANLVQAGIWAKLIWGDIGRPDVLARDLKQDYGIELEELLNVRSFLDHNRVGAPPGTHDRNGITSESTGAFAFRGARISNNEVELSLQSHLERWAPYVRRFGLLTIELHTITPSAAARQIGRGAATAYDATHGYSDQYIVEMGIFHRVAAAAGLSLDGDCFSRFPDNEAATVSVNLFRGAPE